MDVADLVLLILAALAGYYAASHYLFSGQMA